MSHVEFYGHVLWGVYWIGVRALKPENHFTSHIFEVTRCEHFCHFVILEWDYCVRDLWLTLYLIPPFSALPD